MSERVESTSNNSHRRITGLLVLTFTTGMVDAVSVLGLGHVFTANMTGNVAFLGFALASEGSAALTNILAAIAAFVVGAAVGGRFAQRRFVLTLATIPMAAAAVLSSATSASSTSSPSLVAVVVAALAFAMGLRNAVVRKLAIPDLTTTVLTLTLTGLAADSSLAGGTNPRFMRRIASVMALGVGAFVGAVLLRIGAPVAIGVCATLELVGALFVALSPE